MDSFVAVQLESMQTSRCLKETFDYHFTIERGRCPLEFLTTLWKREHTLSHRESSRRQKARA